jgi:hypothetical protein
VAKMPQTVNGNATAVTKPSRWQLLAKSLIMRKFVVAEKGKSHNPQNRNSTSPEQSFHN